MFSQNLQEYFKKLFSGQHTTKIKIFSTIGIIWMVIIGYLVWWNGISDPGFDKSFKWDEWIWFGFVPAIVPFVLYLIWKKEE